MLTFSPSVTPIAARSVRTARTLAVWGAMLLGAVAQAQEIRVGGTGAALGTMQKLGEAYAKVNPKAKINVLPSMGSGGGIKGLLAGALDLALSSRPLSEAEQKAGAVAVEYGRTPLVFATATANKATGLSTQNLADCYTGKVEEWPDGSKLRMILRPIGDSDNEIIKNLSPAVRQAKDMAEKRKGLVLTISDQETASTIEKTPGAVGPATLALLLSENRPLKALALDGVAPSPQAIANGSYPLFKPLLLVTGPKTGESARDFAAFIASPAGRELLVRYGHWVK